MLRLIVSFILASVLLGDSDAIAQYGTGKQSAGGGPVGADYILSVSAGTISAYNTRTNVVDFTGTDVGAVVNSVMGALTSGGEVYLMEGTYPLSTTIYFRSNITMRCGSWGAVIVEQAGMGAGATMLQLGSLSDGSGISKTALVGCQINGRRTDGSASVFPIKATFTSGGSDHVWIVDNLIIDSSNVAITTNSRYVFIYSNQMYTCKNGGIAIAERGVVTGNNVVGTVTGTSGYGILVNNAAFVVITGNRLTSNTQYGIWIGPSSSNLSIAANLVIDNPTEIFDQSAGAAQALGCNAVGYTTTSTRCGPLQLGLTTLTLTGSAFGANKMTASGTAPGAAGAKLEWVCGTNAGTMKMIMYAGTSGTAVTIVDNVGAGVTGC
jgi:parallel beta-helix repeat protein